MSNIGPAASLAPFLPSGSGGAINSAAAKTPSHLYADTVPAPLYLRCTKASFERVPSLDGFRAVSITLVLLSHFLSSKLIPGGLGVLVFFVVSGFLITRLLFAERRAAGQISVTNFYLRRLFRLYPVILVYTVAVIVAFIVSSHHINWYEPFSALFYFANYLYAWSSIPAHAGATSMPFGIFWSLSIEEHFYLVFPLVFIPIGRRRIVPLLIALCLACLAARIGLAYFQPDWLHSHIFYYSDERLDSIAFGVLLACLCESKHADKVVAVAERPIFFALALAGIFVCLAIRNDWFRETLRYSILGVCVAAVLAAVVFSPRYRLLQLVLNVPLVRGIGVLSYSLYVWHTLLPQVFRWYFPELPYGISAPLLIALAITVAAASFYGVERPAMKLRHRFGSRTAY